MGKLKKLLRNERGDLTFFSIIMVLAINIILAFVLLFAKVQINTMNIRNNIKMELNNLTASIYADTYRSQRESNFSEYLSTLYSSSSFTRQLENKVIEGVKENIPLETQDYTVRNISLSFAVVDGRIEYTFHCTVDYRIRMFGNSYPAISRQITLTGYHNTKY